MPAAGVDGIVLRIIIVAAEVESDLDHVVAPIIIEDEHALVEALPLYRRIEVVPLTEVRELLIVIVDKKLVLRFKVVEERSV